ncbi:MAG: type II secretion system protein, partial [Alphaproteobacteria bacterium]
MNIKKNIKPKYLTAFTLIEMSVVLIVISILFVGTFSSSSVVNSVRTNVSKDKLEVIYSLMGTFLKNNKRLPCPASINITSDNANFGNEVRNPLDNKCSGSGIYASDNAGFSNIIVGAIPVKELGVNNDFAYDAFGNLVLYFIDQRFTYDYISNISNDLNLSIPSFGTANFKDIMVIKNRNLKGEVLINSDIIMTLVSYGANGS